MENSKMIIDEDIDILLDDLIMDQEWIEVSLLERSEIGDYAYV